MDFLLNPLGYFARSVYCVGRNYAAHAKELQNPLPSQPMIFLKPVSALSRSGWKVTLPRGVGRVDHEVEVVVALGGGGKHISQEQALEFVAGYAIGIDVTARDLQEQAKKLGHPWTLSKGFDTFAPVSDFVLRSEMGEGPFDFSLKVNGVVRQSGSTSDMLFSIPYLIQYLSTVFTLSPGDLIFTGTPSGVGPLSAGDQVEAVLAGGKATLKVEVGTCS
jgi:2-keto-4-pentenoate hydratase/2-oxohepta-3-ene-1,7-dioic acid hydratase in catechol pathway